MTKILLVEDDKSLREIYGVRLLAEGYDIVSAGDGEEALAMAIKERPNLIVSDVMMPKISGFDMLDILRSTTETRDIKVIMMTALSSDDQRARGEQLGADRYLVKSQVGIEDVVRTVHEVLEDSSNTAAVPVPQAQPVSAQAAADPAAMAAAPVTPVAPVEQPQTVAEMSIPMPDQDAGLPQPTAPFSSPRPANLGERIIEPLTPAEPAAGPSIASQIEQELQAPTDPIASQINDQQETAMPVAAPAPVFTQPPAPAYPPQEEGQQQFQPQPPVQQPPFPPQA